MLTEVNVKITYRDNTIQRINKIEKGDWLDLRAAEDVKLKTGEWRYIDLGVAMELPAGWEALVAPRGSTFKNFGILQFNSIGIIDNSFLNISIIIYMKTIICDRKTTYEILHYFLCNVISFKTIWRVYHY